MATVKTIKKAPKYDPTKNYKWEPTDEFTLTGAEFADLYNISRDMVNKPEGVSILHKVRIFDILQKVFITGVEQDVIVEQEATSPEVKLESKEESPS